MKTRKFQLNLNVLSGRRLTAVTLHGPAGHTLSGTTYRNRKIPVKIDINKLRQSICPKYADFAWHKMERFIFWICWWIVKRYTIRPARSINCFDIVVL